MDTLKSRETQQGGFASIVIAIVLVLVLSLVTIGFAELMRHEEQSALDRHLSSQAYYAAETGINDATKAVNAGYQVPKTDCKASDLSDTHQGAEYLRNSQIGGTDGASYTCLLIDPAPYDLEFGAVDSNQSKAVIMTGVNPVDRTSVALIHSIVISWEPTDGATGGYAPSSASSTHPLPAVGAWWGVSNTLRINLAPLVSTQINRNSLIANNYTALFYPIYSNTPTDTGSNPPPTYDYIDSVGDQGGQILDAKCNDASTPRHCDVRITNLDQDTYLLDMRAGPYSNGQAHVTIEAFDQGGQKLRIKDAQTLVDATGKAQDVLRRVQVRIPSHNDYKQPDYGLESLAGICKQLNLTPSDGSNSCTP